jgi:hypothetical protein
MTSDEQCFNTAMIQAMVLQNMAGLFLAKQMLQTKKRKGRKTWVRKMLLDRPIHGHSEQLLNDMLLNDIDGYRRFLRIDNTLFQEILGRITLRIQRRNTKMRAAITATTKLHATLRYLATGDCYPTCEAGFRVSKATLCNAVPEVCAAIMEEYEAEVLRCPNTVQEWLQVAQQFQTRWNVPHALGALDGKHVRLKNPPKAGSQYYNYKGYFSMVLMALVDANYKFLWVEIGTPGSNSDAQIFNASGLRAAIVDGSLNLPPASPIDNAADQSVEVPFFILGDDAFALKPWLMKPYSGRFLERPTRIYNYRISRGRRVVENAFGILANRFRCLHTCMPQKPDNVEKIVFACVTLHNLIRSRLSSEDEDLRVTEVPSTNSHDEILPSPNDEMPINNRRESEEGKRIRDYLRDYFNGEGAVEWQDDRLDNF